MNSSSKCRMMLQIKFLSAFFFYYKLDCAWRKNKKELKKEISLCTYVIYKTKTWFNFQYEKCLQNIRYIPLPRNFDNKGTIYELFGASGIKE